MGMHVHLKFGDGGCACFFFNFDKLFNTLYNLSKNKGKTIMDLFANIATIFVCIMIVISGSILLYMLGFIFFCIIDDLIH